MCDHQLQRPEAQLPCGEAKQSRTPHPASFHHRSPFCHHPLIYHPPLSTMQATTTSISPPPEIPKHHVLCEACNVAVHAENLRYHRTTRIHTENCKRAGLYCYECSKVFADKLGVRDHNNSLHATPRAPLSPPTPPNDDEPRCNVCFGVLSEEEPYDVHARTQDHMDAAKARGWWCTVCKSPFDSGNALATHTCTPPPADDVSLRTCADCGEVFVTRKQRKKHKNRGYCSVEREVRSCFCTVCNVMVPPDDVAAHREIEGHEDRAKEKGLWCQLCELTFINEAGLADHVVNNAVHLENVKIEEERKGL
ncbi:hypothetical protein FN846DRAFT_364111 [Sphaerosporella brunnea]|uniref:C2H2-type domain-containing protein n=1 Tax=Sphaerosporella brunnea TaxID=1250544 RepID=A0A5J5EIF0_9PEZI|nr:hypothetical protein FN846DRAFT_364111 [Sphaerosporella brunnea]